VERGPDGPPWLRPDGPAGTARHPRPRGQRRRAAPLQAGAPPAHRRGPATTCPRRPRPDLPRPGLPRLPPHPPIGRRQRPANPRRGGKPCF